MSAHILIIDDEPSILEMMQLILEEEGGYQVTLAETISEEVTEIERLHHDLIVLDLKFKSSEFGWELLQKLKLHRGTMSIPIILCTAALGHTREQEVILKQKGIPVLYKPFDVDELLAIVRQHLSGEGLLDKVSEHL